MASMTIARVGRAAGVGVETIRYYHQRGLLPLPARQQGAWRLYDASHVERIRFIRRAQELGFALTEIAELLKLNDGTGHERARRLARAKLEVLRAKLSDLRRMERVLTGLLEECEHGGTNSPCPIIHALAAPGRVAALKEPHAAARLRTSA